MRGGTAGNRENNARGVAVTHMSDIARPVSMTVTRSSLKNPGLSKANASPVDSRCLLIYSMT